MKNSSPTPDLQKTAGLVGNLINQARLVWRLLRDSRVSGWVKLIPFVGLAYLLSPVDLFPDLMLPGLSQLDDLAVILLSSKVFVDLCPPAIVREHLEELMGKQRDKPSGPYIDVPYRVLDREDE